MEEMIQKQEKARKSLFKGYAYVQGNNRPTILNGASEEEILNRLKSWNENRPEKVKYSYCNIGSYDSELDKYGKWEKYEVGTGKAISNIYLTIPKVSKEEFKEITAYLKQEGAHYNVNKKQWYITPDKADKFKEYLPKEAEPLLPKTKAYITLPKMDKEVFQETKEMLKEQGAHFDWTEKKWYTSSEEVEDLQNKVNIFVQSKTEKVNVGQDYAMESVSKVNDTAESTDCSLTNIVSGIENPYIIHLMDGSAVRIEQEEIMNIAGVKAFPELNSGNVVEAIEKALSERMRLLDTEKYYISVRLETGENKCCICFKDSASNNFDIYGDQMGIHFPSASKQEILTSVEGYIKSMEATRKQTVSSELSSPEEKIGEGITGYRGIKEKDANGFDCITRVEKLEGILLDKVTSDIHPEVVTYLIQDEQGKHYEINSNEWFTDKQGAVLLRAMKNELEQEAFDLIAQSKLDAAQMEAVRNGLQDGLPVLTVANYATPMISAGNMDLYRYGMNQGVLFNQLEKIVNPVIAGDIAWEEKRRQIDVLVKENKQTIINDLQRNGFRSEKGIMDNMIKLRQITQRDNTLQDIAKAYKEGTFIGTPAGSVVNELGKAFQQQESMKLIQEVTMEV